jgi:invasion protein IalB
MTNTNAYRLSVMAASLAGFVATATLPAAAQQAQAPQGWFKACSKQNIMTANTGQLLTAVSLIELKGKINRKIFQVSVPSGRLVPPGIGLQIDGGKAQKVDYVICFPDRCVAEAALTDQMVASFKKGGELVLTSVNFQNQQNAIKVSLQGFTGAYDGEALQQADIEARQKALQDYVSKNNEDFAKKLKEEQEKAKAAN